MPASDTQRLNLLALARVRGLGEASLKALVRAYPDLSAVWEASSDDLQRVLTGARLNNPRDAVRQLVGQRSDLIEAAKRDVERLEHDGIGLILEQDDEYPVRLRGIKDSPPWLFVQGDVQALSLPSLIAVVGTRNPSPQGVDLARAMSLWLADRGYGIVSGLAEGIDEAAHQTALDLGVPTIGVLATGVFLVFPASTGHVRKQIATGGGAVVTEYLPYESYSSTRFVRRNRIIAGLAFATVPVEARRSSGTAHTYHFAREADRFTFGVKRGSVLMQNGILQLLHEDERPIFDLDSPESMEGLARELAIGLPASMPMRPRGQLLLPVLREFERIVGAYPVGEEDFAVLRAKLDEAWKRMGRGSTRGHPGS